MLKVALLSKWHPHARGYGRDFSSHPECEVTVIWDEIADRGMAWADELSCDFEPDYDRLLARSDVDLICCTAPTEMHRELFEKAAAAGKHIFTEKVLTSKKADALAVKAAVEKAGVKFVISLPMLTQPHILFAKKLLEDGALGKISYMRVRNAHDGVSRGWLEEKFIDPANAGGGAMMDLGAHPMYIASYLFGAPVRISSAFTNVWGTSADDNCVCSVEFENGIVAVTETGFVTSASPFTFELSGSGGTFIHGGPEGGSHLKLTGENAPARGQWTEPDYSGITPPPSAVNQIVNAVLRDETAVFDMDKAIALTELMDGAYRSYRESRFVEFTEI